MMGKRKNVFVPVLLVLCFLGAPLLFAGGKAEAAQEEEGLTITILPQCDAPVDEDSPLIAWQENYLEEKLGFPVNFEFIYLERANQAELLNLRLAAGDVPDIFQAYPDSQFRNFIKQGVLRSYDLDRLAEVAPNYYGQITKHGGKDIWQFGRGPDGKYYGVPGTSIRGQYPYVPIWRDDWLRNVGINKIPSTIEEAEKAFYAFVNDDPDGNGKKDTYALSDKGMAVIFGAFGGLPPYADGKRINWTLVDGKINASITTDDMRDALRLLSKWYADGLIDPEWITGENKGQYWGYAVSFWNGEIGFSMPGMYYHIPSPEQIPERGGAINWEGFHSVQGPDASYTTGPLIVGPEGKKGSYQWGVVEGWYAVYGRDVSDEQLEKWWQVNELQITDGLLQDSILFGIPDVDWKYKDDGSIELINEYDITGQAEYGMGYNGFDRGITGLGWDFPRVQRELNSPEMLFAEEVAEKNEGLPNLVWGDYPSKSRYAADVESMTIEAYTEFITGERDVETDWDRFVDAVNKAGLTELTRDAQEWYDTYQ